MSLTTRTTNRKILSERKQTLIIVRCILEMIIRQSTAGRDESENVCYDEDVDGEARPAAAAPPAGGEWEKSVRDKAEEGEDDKATSRKRLL